MLAYDARWMGSHGIGRFAAEIAQRIPFGLQFTEGKNPASMFSAFELGNWLRRSGRKGLYSPGYIPPIGTNVPFVFTIHDLNHLDVPHNSSRAKRLFYRTVILPGVHRAYRIVTVSEFAKQRIISWSGCTPDKVIVTCNGVSEVFLQYSEPIKLGYEYLFCCSNRKGHKNEDRLLAAFKLSALYKELKLVFTGDVDEKIAARINMLGLEASVVFTGRVSEAELAAWYRGAIATVFPSLYEGFGLPVIESMACGTPVVTSNTTSLPEVGGDAVLYVDPMSVESIAEGIKRIVGDNALRNRMQEMGKERVSFFTWERSEISVRNALTGMIKE
jgi:glycosyltransferase involved in cell wall biosynthesis